ncbi:MAG: DUF3606 domain-containing protein [Mesorhizobium sp.]|uniref:DUF3606 domain-containing protein n=1 Tax=Mesorhizobium sp. TaxID=1871066 RepID=UPI000FE8A7BE|nr:DUF3606 domain-containing protein [Mesorhizobium sp.]RWM15156.1 MAG: DUF3606 domain-containing protein [Mesorhizobium sp.]TIP75852.1 MAG: DUF3606 domain-containing protein [Mesorhizobium sp.]TIQ12580.1 MAG: DUF3606 domain-containing protein [Mesorhizobium sp.]TIR53637.1 MAG: DUF3606 domain-containing protein [Mesorhizobium sp.]TJV95157.1 MAG: DUF3606 domain-containing protein [Mesorhizobium sp.]
MSSQTSADENYEVEYFAVEMGITPVRDLMKANGNDRAALIETARALPERN